jgi:hypothetical protein
MQVIEIANLRLEAQTAEHAEDMFVVLSDPAIYEHENEPGELLMHRHVTPPCGN